jgi:xanthine dehydrogenase accessory factor
VIVALADRLGESLMNDWNFVNWINEAWMRVTREPAVLVTVVATKGSVPRGAGTLMVVFAQGELGTIGGGHLEFQALAHARLILSGQPVPKHLSQVLGPSLGPVSYTHLTLPTT